MPNEAKVGVVIGVALVIVMAVVFFRKDAAHARSAPEVAARPPGALAAPSARRHVVQEGETLFSLAKRYYNDSGKFVELYQVNRGVLKTPEELPAGTVLIVPEV